MPSDEHLVAYLDGALTPAANRQIEALLSDSTEAQARLEQLRAGQRPFAEALDAMLPQAPMDRLLAGMAAADPATKPYEAPASSGHAGLHGFAAYDRPGMPYGINDNRPSPANVGWAPVAAAAAILVALIGGFMGGLTLPERGLSGLVLANNTAQTAPAPAQPAARGWRQAVADYQSLFNTDSLTPFQGGDAGLPLANAALGLPLEGVATDLRDLNFRRVQVLDFNGKTLVQLAYLGTNGQPVSFCVILSGKPDSPKAFETRNDLGIIHWVKGGYGFMLIGDVEPGRLREMAAEVDARVGI